MATLVGGIDESLRAFIRIESPGSEDGFLAQLDTGFNGEIFIDEADAVRLGFELRDGFESVELASGVSQQIRYAVGTIHWLGQVRRIEALAAVTTTTRARRADDPVALVGTALLNPHLVLLDFANRTIEIEAQS